MRSRIAAAKTGRRSALANCLDERYAGEVDADDAEITPHVGLVLDHARQSSLRLLLGEVERKCALKTLARDGVEDRPLDGLSESPFRVMGNPSRGCRRRNRVPVAACEKDCAR
jgi:hypothetical protein